jgi:predicted nucleic acid-binding protein
LETAIVGAADCLVTGDSDLLALRPVGESGEARQRSDADFRGVAILRPSEFLSLYDRA